MLSQVCDLGPSVGLGAPIWSLHASFIGLSEAIFQNWLHLRTCGGAHSPGVVNERGGSRGLCRSGGGWGCAGSPRGGGAPAGPPPRLHPEVGPLGWQAVTLRPFLIFVMMSPAVLTRVFQKMLPKTSFSFCLVCLGLHKYRWQRGQEKRSKRDRSFGIEPLNLAHGFPAVCQARDYLFAF